MKRLALIGLFIVLIFPGWTGRAAAASQETDAVDARAIVSKARIVLDGFMADKNNTWFQENVQKAKGILIFPEVLKAGFFWGGSGGNGVLVVREGSGSWSQPAFYTIGSVSFGFQIGAQSAEVVMLAMSQKAIDSLYASSLKLGGDVAVAAGPRGTGIKKVITADFISFARAKGLYAGLDFEGSGVQVRDDLNKAYYGRPVRPVEIIVKQEVTSPASEGLLDALRKVH